MEDLVIAVCFQSHPRQIRSEIAATKASLEPVCSLSVFSFDRLRMTCTVTGIMGAFAALEAVKVICGFGETLQQKLVVFDAVTARFRNVKLRPRNTDCDVCGDHPIVTKLLDYELFCGSSPSDKAVSLDFLGSGLRISCSDYYCLSQSGADSGSYVLIDTREANQFKICRLPNSISVCCQPSSIAP